MIVLHTTYLLLAIYIGKSIAQNDINNVCTWTQLRAATVRDALYVNGGDLASNAAAGLDGSTYVFNFSQSFDTNQIDFSALFTRLPARIPAADYFDGTMFATDDKIYVYGYA
jgi:hypothetical protein